VTRPLRVAFQWSGGKDSALALSLLLARDDISVERLVTTVAPDESVATVHHVPSALLRAQAESIGIPLEVVPMAGPELEGYAERIGAVGTRLRDAGFDAVAFGDLSVSGARVHRDELFGPLGLQVLEPLWQWTSRECIDRFLASGMRAVTVVVDAAVLGPERVGVPLDREFVESLPADVDPCGELGEYHTFVHDGPIFSEPVLVRQGVPRSLSVEIGTTRGRQRFDYWVCTPQPA
jgi:uncharacterized protein (TIGR00290 family)